jgi:rubrerythrin
LSGTKAHIQKHFRHDFSTISPRHPAAPAAPSGRINAIKDGETMAQLKKGTKTHANLKEAFAGESQANRRYLYFAKVADVEGYPEIAANFRETAEGETGHAHGHLDYLKTVGDPATDLPIGDTVTNLKAAIAGETHEYTDMYPGMARTARDEGFAEIADWFETLAKAEKSHAGRFDQMLRKVI